MTRRRRILFVIKNLQQGGTERQILKMMASLDSQVFETALCTLSPEIHYRGVPKGEPRFALHAKGVAAVRAVRSAIAEFQPDLVHSFRDGVNRVIWRALGSTANGPAWLMSVRGRPILPLDLLWARFMHKRAYRVTVNSVGIRTALHRYAGIAKRKIQVIANLIDESTFRASSTEERRKARQELGLSQDAFVWVLPARMSWVKNQIGLVLALAILKRRGALGPEVEVVLAGRQRDLLASKLVPMLARVLGVRSHLRIFPAFTDPSVLYRASDALVLPSWAEGMPNVVLESLLSAVPAVVTHQANRDDLVRHGDSGFTVRTGSAVALADGMSRLMQLPPEARHRLGESGRQALIQRFARDPIVATLSSLYETAIAANLLQRDKVTSVVFSRPAPATIPPNGPLQDSALNEISV